MSQDADPHAIDIFSSTCRRVEEFLSVGETVSKVEDGTYYAKRGSTVVGIHVVPWMNDVLVHVSANVVQHADLKPELLKTLLEINYRSSFGSFGLAEDGTIILRHTLLGSTLEKEQLVPSVLAVARHADEWDDKIIAMAGGETAVETLRRTTDSIKPDEGQG